MKRLFEIASGSIVGRRHRHIYQNNQDAYDCITNEDATIAVVCDGCSGGKHSEVGAKLGAKLIIQEIAFALKNCSEVTKFDDIFWEEITQKVVEKIGQIAQTIDSKTPIQIIINDYFLFTIIGVVITPDETVIFSLGDGVIAINNKVKIIGEEYQNKPPYLAYKLCSDYQDIKIKIESQLPTNNVSSLLIGSDGVKDLINVENKLIPGKSEKVKNIAQFWEENRYFQNPDMIRRYLYLLNQDISKPDWQQQKINKQVGLLPDDTTLIVIRKKTKNKEKKRKERK